VPHHFQTEAAAVGHKISHGVEQVSRSPLVAFDLYGILRKNYMEACSGSMRPITRIVAGLQSTRGQCLGAHNWRLQYLLHSLSIEDSYLSIRKAGCAEKR
jgi:hypothetical protein